MCTAGLPRAEDVQHAAWPGCCASRLDDFDVVHDNQVLGYGMLDIEKMGLPAGHHASTTRSPSTGASTSPRRPPWRKRLTLRRWYGFLRMQGRVARRRRQDPHAVSESAPSATSSPTSASTRPGSR